MPLYDWSQVREEQLTPLFTRRVVHTSHLTIARLVLQAGVVVPEHHHYNEQFSMIEKGALKFVLAGEEIVVSAGQSLHIPPDVPHSAVALEETVAIDIFTPAREDWIRGDDAYLRSK